jgi:hypothetical protein
MYGPFDVSVTRFHQKQPPSNVLNLSAYHAVRPEPWTSNAGSFADGVSSIRLNRPVGRLYVSMIPFIQKLCQADPPEQAGGALPPLPACGETVLSGTTRHWLSSGDGTIHPSAGSERRAWC